MLITRVIALVGSQRDAMRSGEVVFDHGERYPPFSGARRLSDTEIDEHTALDSP
jgi:hypothetical protein